MAKSTTKSTKTAKKVTGKGNDSYPPEEAFLHDQAWLDQQREALLTERASYTANADRLAAEAAALMADREPGDVQFDEESGEGDTIAVERDRDLALSAAARQAVAEIDQALARLDNGTYGHCAAGDDIIPKERLEAIPEASVCVQHKTSMF
ncbi:MAG: TraR/DksA family transcriptional regulator [Acidimicrobiales bacterium]